MKNEKEELTLEEGWKKFLQNCKIKNLAKRTIEYYREFFFYFLIIF